MNSFLYIAIIASGLAVTSAAVDCVNDPCRKLGAQRVACQYPDPKPAPACGTVVIRGFTQAEKDEIVNLLNNLRQYVASGKEKRGPKGPQPPATDMQIVRWNNDIANDVQRTLDQCNYGYPKCVVTNGNVILPTLGLITRWSLNKPMNKNITETYLEVYNKGATSMTRDIVKHYKYNVRYVLYAMMMFSKINKIGCGKIIFNPGGSEQTRCCITCVYAPVGLRAGHPIYKIPDDQHKTQAAYI